MRSLIYEERATTVDLSTTIFKKFQQLDFVMLTTKTGTGKTFVGIRTAYLLSPNTHILAFMPKSKILEGGWETSVEAFNQAMNASISVTSFSYSQLNTKDGPNHIKEAIKQHEDRPILLIFDEAHMLKLSSSGQVSKRAKRALDLAKVEAIDKTLGMSATPIPNSYLEAATYFILAGFYKNKTQFIKEQILHFDAYFSPLTRDPYTKEIRRDYFRDPDLLDEYINQISVHLEGDHLLPPVDDIFYTFALDDKIKYVDPVFEEEFDDTTERTRLEHYRQVKKYKRKGYYEYSATAMAELRRVITPDPNRLASLGYILYHHFYNNTPCPILIFYQYNLELETILDFLETSPYFKDVHIQQVNGQYKQVDTPKDPHTVILIQYQAGAAAIEFPTSKVSIFFMPTYVYQNYMQAKGRNRRASTTDLVTHYHLTATKTLDEEVWKIIENKEDFNQAIQDAYFDIYED